MLSDAVAKLVRSVFASQYSMWRSTAERLGYRRKGFCMDSFFKSGSVFITTTPDVGTMVLAVLPGKATLEEVEQMKNGTIVSRASRADIASGLLRVF